MKASIYSEILAIIADHRVLESRGGALSHYISPKRASRHAAC
jgi:hypothetical protein